MLSTAIEMLSESECAALATRLRTLGGQLAGWQPGRDFELAYGCRGGVHLALMREPTADALADIETIARFRAGFARMHCSLRVREGMTRELDSPGWTAAAMLPLRDELKASLAARDDEAAIVTLDPFAI